MEHRREKKLLTLNTHSLVEAEYEKKLQQFVQGILHELPDVIALQEVNQSLGEVQEAEPERYGYVCCEEDRSKAGCLSGGSMAAPVIRRDNHVLRAAKLLREAGVCYNWTWIPLKIGYGRYEEGLALMSRQPIEGTDQFFISRSRDFQNWKTRKALGIKAGGIWYYSVHMSWWDDAEEPFAQQWDVTMRMLQAKEAPNGAADLPDAKAGMLRFVMGDFNCPADVSSEGYAYVRASGWYDTYVLAKDKGDGITAGGVIDGWGERSQKEKQGMRIDYIWCSEKAETERSYVIFNGEREPVVSDHYGTIAVVYV